MKISTYLLLCLFILVASCSKEIVSPSGVSYQQSLNSWLAYKASVNNNYTYTVVSGSVFGFGSETKITVQNGVVTARDYKATRKVGNPPVDSIYNTWVETAANLNTHSAGAESISLDDIYTKAKSEWLTADKSKNKIYFETDDKGLISNCGYVPNNCADDCFRGITIKWIAKL